MKLDDLTDRQVSVLRALSRRRVLRVSKPEGGCYIVDPDRPGRGRRVAPADVRALVETGLVAVRRTWQSGREMVITRGGHAIAVTLGRAEALA